MDPVQIHLVKTVMAERTFRPFSPAVSRQVAVRMDESRCA